MGLGSAARVGIYDYLGYYDVCYIGDEVKNPGRVIPRSILISLVAVAAIYLTMNLFIIGVVPWRSFVPQAGTPLADPPPPVVSWFIERIYGSGRGQIIHGHGALDRLCKLLQPGAWLLPNPLRRRAGWKFLRRLLPRAPTQAISACVAAAGRHFGNCLQSFAVAHRHQCAADNPHPGAVHRASRGVMWLRRHKPDAERPFKMWLYPVPAFIALAGWLFLFATTDPTTLLYSISVLAIGVVLFLAWSFWTRRWPFASVGPIQRPERSIVTK